MSTPATANNKNQHNDSSSDGDDAEVRYYEPWEYCVHYDRPANANGDPDFIEESAGACDPTSPAFACTPAPGLAAQSASAASSSSTTVFPAAITTSVLTIGDASEFLVQFVTPPPDVCPPCPPQIQERVVQQLRSLRRVPVVDLDLIPDDVLQNETQCVMLRYRHAATGVFSQTSASSSSSSSAAAAAGSAFPAAPTPAGVPPLPPTAVGGGAGGGGGSGSSTSTPISVSAPAPPAQLSGVVLDPFMNLAPSRMPVLLFCVVFYPTLATAPGGAIDKLMRYMEARRQLDSNTRCYFQILLVSPHFQVEGGDAAPENDAAAAASAAAAQQQQTKRPSSAKMANRTATRSHVRSRAPAKKFVIPGAPTNSSFIHVPWCDDDSDSSVAAAGAAAGRRSARSTAGADTGAEDSPLRAVLRGFSSVIATAAVTWASGRLRSLAAKTLPEPFYFATALDEPSFLVPQQQQQNQAGQPGGSSGRIDLRAVKYRADLHLLLGRPSDAWQLLVRAPQLLDRVAARGPGDFLWTCSAYDTLNAIRWVCLRGALLTARRDAGWIFEHRRCFTAEQPPAGFERARTTLSQIWEKWADALRLDHQGRSPMFDRFAEWSRGFQYTAMVFDGSTPVFDGTIGAAAAAGVGAGAGGAGAGGVAGQPNASGEIGGGASIPAGAGAANMARNAMAKGYCVPARQFDEFVTNVLGDFEEDLKNNIITLSHVGSMKSFAGSDRIAAAARIEAESRFLHFQALRCLILPNSVYGPRILLASCRSFVNIYLPNARTCAAEIEPQSAFFGAMSSQSGGALPASPDAAPSLLLPSSSATRGSAGVSGVPPAPPPPNRRSASAQDAAAVFSTPLQRQASTHPSTGAAVSASATTSAAATPGYLACLHLNLNLFRTMRVAIAWLLRRAGLHRTAAEFLREALTYEASASVQQPAVALDLWAELLRWVGINVTATAASSSSSSSLMLLQQQRKRFSDTVLPDTESGSPNRLSPITGIVVRAFLEASFTNYSSQQQQLPSSSSFGTMSPHAAAAAAANRPRLPTHIATALHLMRTRAATLALLRAESQSALFFSDGPCTAYFQRFLARSHDARFAACRTPAENFACGVSVVACEMLPLPQLKSPQPFRSFGYMEGAFPDDYYFAKIAAPVEFGGGGGGGIAATSERIIQTGPIVWVVDELCMVRVELQNNFVHALQIDRVALHSRTGGGGGGARSRSSISGNAVVVLDDDDDSSDGGGGGQDAASALKAKTNRGSSSGIVGVAFDSPPFTIPAQQSVSLTLLFRPVVVGEAVVDGISWSSAALCGSAESEFFAPLPRPIVSPVMPELPRAVVRFDLNRSGVVRGALRNIPSHHRVLSLSMAPGVQPASSSSNNNNVGHHRRTTSSTLLGLMSSSGSSSAQQMLLLQQQQHQQQQNNEMFTLTVFQGQRVEIPLEVVNTGGSDIPLLAPVAPSAASSAAGGSFSTSAKQMWFGTLNAAAHGQHCQLRACLGCATFVSIVMPAEARQQDLLNSLEVGSSIRTSLVVNPRAIQLSPPVSEQPATSAASDNNNAANGGGDNAAAAASNAAAAAAAAAYHTTAFSTTVRLEVFASREPPFQVPPARIAKLNSSCPNVFCHLPAHTSRLSMRINVLPAVRVVERPRISRGKRMYVSIVNDNRDWPVQVRRDMVELLDAAGNVTERLLLAGEDLCPAGATQQLVIPVGDRVTPQQLRDAHHILLHWTYIVSDTVGGVASCSIVDGSGGGGGIGSVPIFGVNNSEALRSGKTKVSLEELRNQITDGLCIADLAVAISVCSVAPSEEDERGSDGDLLIASASTGAFSLAAIASASASAPPLVVARHWTPIETESVVESSEQLSLEVLGNYRVTIAVTAPRRWAQETTFDIGFDVPGGALLDGCTKGVLAFEDPSSAVAAAASCSSSAVDPALHPPPNGESAQRKVAAAAADRKAEPLATATTPPALSSKRLKQRRAAAADGDEQLLAPSLKRSAARDASVPTIDGATKQSPAAADGSDSGEDDDAVAGQDSDADVEQSGGVKKGAEAAPATAMPSNASFGDRMHSNTNDSFADMAAAAARGGGTFSAPTSSTLASSHKKVALVDLQAVLFAVGKMQLVVNMRTEAGEEKRFLVPVSVAATHL